VVPWRDQDATTTTAAAGKAQSVPDGARRLFGAVKPGPGGGRQGPFDSALAAALWREWAVLRRLQRSKAQARGALASGRAFPELGLCPVCGDFTLGLMAEDQAVELQGRSREAVVGAAAGGAAGAGVAADESGALALPLPGPLPRPLRLHLLGRDGGSDADFAAALSASHLTKIGLAVRGRVRLVGWRACESQLALNLTSPLSLCNAPLSFPICRPPCPLSLLFARQVPLCDGCDAEVHLPCAGLDTVPEGNFFCKACTDRGKAAAHAKASANADAAKSAKGKAGPRVPAPGSAPAKALAAKAPASRAAAKARSPGSSTAGRAAPVSSSTSSQPASSASALSSASTLSGSSLLAAAASPAAYSAPRPVRRTAPVAWLGFRPVPRPGLDWMLPADLPPPHRTFVPAPRPALPVAPGLAQQQPQSINATGHSAAVPRPAGGDEDGFDGFSRFASAQRAGLPAHWPTVATTLTIGRRWRALDGSARAAWAAGVAPG